MLIRRKKISNWFYFNFFSSFLPLFFPGREHYLKFPFAFFLLVLLLFLLVFLLLLLLFLLDFLLLHVYLVKPTNNMSNSLRFPFGPSLMKIMLRFYAF